jgi:putative ABC transport system permease protein
MLLALAGGVVGVALARLGFDAFLALVPPDQPRVHRVALDARVLTVTATVCVGAGLLFGVVPAVSAGGRRAAALLRNMRVSGAGAVRARTRRLLLVSELSLALVLLAAAGLMVRTIGNLLAIDPGFASSEVLSAQVSLPARYEAQQRAVFYGQVEERVRAVPGVVNAAFTYSLPVEGSNWNSIFLVEGQPVPARADLPSAAFTPVTAAYFDTMGIRLLRGRGFQPGDTESAPRVTVVNESFARRFWPDGDALGKRIKQGWPEDKTPWREIVGVVNDVKTARIDRPAAIQAYLPMAQEPVAFAALVVRAAGDPAALPASVDAAIHEIDRNLPVYDVRTLDQVIGAGVGQQRLLMVLLLGFGGLALLMAAIGVFGVTAHTVAQRRHELGVRMALGADRGRVLRMVVSQELRVCAVGIAVGLVGALAATGLLRNLLFGIAPRDPATIGGVTALLIAVTALACYLPARRATRVDPVAALKCE